MLTRRIRVPPVPETFRTLHRGYRKRFQNLDDGEPVKIAILDTGIDLSHEDLQQPRPKLSGSKVWKPASGEQNQIDRIIGKKNFCDDRDDDENVDDIDGHGTHVAGIILQLAPRARLLIARVFQGNKDYGRPGNDQEQPEVPGRSSAQEMTIQPKRVEDVSSGMLLIISAVLTVSP